MTRWSERQANAWEGWAKKCVNFLRGDDTFDYSEVDSYTIDQLKLPTHRDEGARLLRFNLRSVPIVSWSKLGLYTPVRWISLVAFLATGFPEVVSAVLSQEKLLLVGQKPDWEMPEYLDRELRKRISEQSTRRKVLLLRSAGETIMGDWLPSPAWSCFALTESELHDSLPKFGVADFVLIEVDKGPGDHLSKKDLGRLLDSVRGLGFYRDGSTLAAALSSQPIEYDGHFPVIVAPASLDDAMSRAERVAIADQFELSSKNSRTQEA